MTSQQEYEEFTDKFLKTTLELKSDFEHLSVENQRRFAKNMNALLTHYGFAVSLRDFLNLTMR